MVTIFKNLPSASKHAEQLGLLYLAGGKMTCHSHLGKHETVSYTVTGPGAEGGAWAASEGELGNWGKESGSISWLWWWGLHD